MNNKPHTEEAKRKISEAQKRRWENLTDEERKNKKLSNFWAVINSKEREQEDKEWLEKHKQYIWEEFTRLFD